MTEVQQKPQGSDEDVKKLSNILVGLKENSFRYDEKQKEEIIELVSKIEKSPLHKRVLEFWKEVEYPKELENILGKEHKEGTGSESGGKQPENINGSTSSTGDGSKFSFPYI